MDEPRLARLILILLLAGCGARPTHPVEDALYTDLRIIVVTEERIDWIIDESEFQQITPRVMESVCQTPPPQRAGLRRWLDQAIQAEGGNAEQVWRSNGKDLGEVSDLLELERIRGALTHAEARLEDCPFWLEPDPNFTGVQSSRARFTILAESMGGMQLVLDDELFLGAAANGRLIPLFGLTHHTNFGVGLEGGAASTFPRDKDGVRSVKAVFTLGVPLLFRVSNGPWRFDTEVAGTLRIPDSDTGQTQPGVRLSQAIGTTTVRIAGFMPYVMLWAGYEYIPDYNGNRGFSVIRAGPRVGVDWDP